MVLVVSGAGDETGGVGPVDEADHAVMEQEQIVRHLSDGRTTGIAVPSNGQEELMLGGREAGGLGLLLAPALEMAEAGPQAEQTGVDLVR